MKAIPIILLTLLAAIDLNAQSFTNHIYRWIPGNFTWQQAKSDAESRGGHLVTITSQEELDYIESLSIIGNGSYWLGATDEVNEGQWTWVTGEPWEFEVWATTEPNNQGGSEHYLSGATSGLISWWNDITINFQLPYILEIDDQVGLCSPRQALGQVQVVNGFVVGVTIIDTGCGYTNTPMVTIVGGGGNGAVAEAVMTNGRVTDINILATGCCYTGTPQVIIDPPPHEPSISISVSRIKLTMDVVPGTTYLVEFTTNFMTWEPAGPPFIPVFDTVEQEYPVEAVRRFYRIRQIPPP